MTASAKQSSSTTRKTATRVAPSTRRNKNIRLAPVTARVLEVTVEQRSVPDPMDPGSFRTSDVNTSVDLLLHERARCRISEAQYQVGRMIQAVYERGSGARLGSSGWGEGGSRDQTIAHELAIIYAIEDAERVRKFTRRLETALGTVGARFLRQVLTERVTFAQYAAARGKSGERAVAQVAAHFRLLLEGLTEAQHTARGPAPTVPNDEYADRARGLDIS